MTVGELLVKLGFEVDSLKLNEFIKDLGELNLSSVIAAAGMKGLVEGITSVMQTADTAVAALNKMSTITGVQPQIFQQWDNAAQQFNMTAGETTGILSDIQRQINLMKVGQGNAIKWAQIFKIPIAGRENDPAGVFHDILKSLEGMDPAQRRLLLNMAGINEDAALLVGHEDEIFKASHNTTEQFAKMQRFIHDIRGLTNDWKTLIIGLGAGLAPILDFLVNIVDFLVKGLNLLEQWLPTVTSIIAALVVLFATLKGIALISVGLTGLKALAALGPVFEGIAGIAAALIPALRVLGVVGIAGGLIYDLLRPKDQTSNIDQSRGDFNQSNTYHIQGGDPNDIFRRIEEFHKAQMRDVQGQAPQISW